MKTTTGSIDYSTACVIKSKKFNFGILFLVESLYKTPEGRYYLLNQSRERSGIEESVRYMSEEEAREWLEDARER